jgi:hypothetical protein
MTDRNPDNEPDIPTDTDELGPDTADRRAAKKAKEDQRERDSGANPPRTTTGKNFTAPKFGSAGSGGLELEPGLDKD